MADQTVISILQQIDSKLTSLENQLAAETAARQAQLETVRQLVSDTQMVALHIENTLGTVNS